MSLFVHWLISVLAIAVAAYIVPGVSVTLLAAVILSVVLGVINLFIKPILTLITLPITILTLGLFSLVLNAVLILLAAMVVPDFVVDGFWPALLFSIVLSLVNMVFGFWKK